MSGIPPRLASFACPNKSEAARVRTCGKQESSSSSSAARLWKHAPTRPPPVCFPPVLTRRTFRSLLHHFLFCSSLQAHRPPSPGTGPHSFPRLPLPARAARRAHLGSERRDGRFARSHAMFCCQMFPLLLLNEQLLQAGESGRALGLKPKAGSPGKSSRRSCVSIREAEGAAACGPLLFLQRSTFGGI